MSRMRDGFRFGLGLVLGMVAAAGIGYAAVVFLMLWPYGAWALMGILLLVGLFLTLVLHTSHTA